MVVISGCIGYNGKASLFCTEVIDLYLKWMGRYRGVVEQLIHYCNVYASVYKKELTYPKTGLSVSFSQIQVLEYLLENEELNQNMSTIARRLGITLSSFSKMINVLVEKGLVEKFYISGNKKNIIVHINDRGRALYDEYSNYIFRHHFAAMFDSLEALSNEQLSLLEQALSHHPNSKQEKTPCAVLIPVGRTRAD